MGCGDRREIRRIRIPNPELKSENAVEKKNLDAPHLPARARRRPRRNQTPIRRACPPRRPSRTAAGAPAPEAEEGPSPEPQAGRTSPGSWAAGWPPSAAAAREPETAATARRPCAGPSPGSRSPTEGTRTGARSAACSPATAA